jgi:hypothetical protein
LELAVEANRQAVAELLVQKEKHNEEFRPSIGSQ